MRIAFRPDFHDVSQPVKRPTILSRQCSTSERLLYAPHVFVMARPDPEENAVALVKGPMANEVQ